MRVKTTQKCFIHNRLYEEGEVFEFSGPIASYMVEVDEDGNPVQQVEAKRQRKPKTDDATAANA